MRVDRIGVYPGRPAGGQDHLTRPDEQETASRAGLGGFGRLRGPVVCQQAHHPGRMAAAVDDQIEQPAVRPDRHPGGQDARLQAFGHRLRGVGADGGAPLARVVVGSVTGELAMAVGGEGHADLGQVQEGPGRTGGFGQCVVTVHRAAREQGSGEFGDRIRGCPSQSQFVIGLLVGARIAGGARADLVGDQADIGLVLVPPGGGQQQLVRGRVTGRAGAHHDRGGDDGRDLQVADPGRWVHDRWVHSRAMCRPPSTWMTSPVE